MVRPISTMDGDRITALARATTNWGRWDVGAWGGIVLDEPAGAMSLVGELGLWAVRTEFAVRAAAVRALQREPLIGGARRVDNQT